MKSLELIANSPPYHEFMRLLRNHETVQQGFLEQVHITPEQQAAYMGRHAECYFICLCDGQPCGYIGDIEGDIRLAVSPAHQRQGVGFFMLQEFLKIRPHCRARVKPENRASLRLFEKAGFRVSLIHLDPPDFKPGGRP